MNKLLIESNKKKLTKLNKKYLYLIYLYIFVAAIISFYKLQHEQIHKNVYELDCGNDEFYYRPCIVLIEDTLLFFLKINAK